MLLGKHLAMKHKNKYQVVVSERTKQMLVSHAAFLAQDNLKAANRLVDEFEKCANSLEEMPQRCPWLKGDYIPMNKYRFTIFEKRYMIIFQIIIYRFSKIVKRFLFIGI